MEHVRDLGLEEIITGLQAKGWFTMRHRLLHDLRAHSAHGRLARAAVHQAACE